jgi:hypothetical protein
MIRQYCRAKVVMAPLIASDPCLPHLVFIVASLPSNIVYITISHLSRIRFPAGCHVSICRGRQRSFCLGRFEERVGMHYVFSLV